jgi:hypothetical protein
MKIVLENISPDTKKTRCGKILNSHDVFHMLFSHAVYGMLSHDVGERRRRPIIIIIIFFSLIKNKRRRMYNTPTPAEPQIM